MEYLIYEGLYAEFLKRIHRIYKKCKEYGCAFSYTELGEEYISKVTGELMRFIRVDVTGTAKIGDWELIGVIQHTDAGNIIKTVQNFVSVPQLYYTTSCYCDHCKAKRHRDKTVLIRNTKTGVYQQVGKACLKAYTGGLSAELVAAYMDLRTALEYGTDVANYAGGTTYYKTEDILCYIAETVLKFGYIKARTIEGESNPDATWRKAWRYYILKNDLNEVGKLSNTEIKQAREAMKKVQFNAHSAEAQQLAERAKAWILSVDESTELINNIQVLIKSTGISKDNLGILSALIPMYQSAIQKQQLQNESDWVYDIGNKVKVEVGSMRCVTQYSNMYSTVYIYNIIDTQNNVYIWKTTKELDLSKSPKFVAGAVKELSEYRGTKQTVLIRCKLLDK